MAANSLLLKPLSIALVAWAILGTTASGGFAALTLGILLLLLALLDAAQIVTPGTGRETPINDADIGALVRRLFSLAVGPFYVVLIVLSCAGILGRSGREDLTLPTVAAQPGVYPVPAQADTTMCGGHGCGSAGGCGTSGCGASSGGACGCSGGAKKATPVKPKPVVSAPEAQARTEAIKRRSMTIPTANLPGIGPNARPLPPGVTPNPNVQLPPSAQKLLNAPKPPAPNAAQNPAPNPNPSPASTPAPAVNPAPPPTPPGTTTPLPATTSTAPPLPPSAPSPGQGTPPSPPSSSTTTPPVTKP